MTTIAVNKTTLEPLAVPDDQLPDYPQEDWLIGVSLVALVGVPAKYWKLNVSGDAVVEMTSGEKEGVDAAELAAAQDAQRDAIDLMIRQYVEAAYPPHRQRTLSHLMLQAKIDGNDARAAYVQQAWDWISSCVLYYYGLRNIIDATTTVMECAAVAPDFTDLDAINPNVTIEASMSIGGQQ